MFADDRDLMSAKHGINAIALFPYHQTGIPILSLLLPIMTKHGGSFRNVNNLYSSCRQTLVKSHAEMNQCISAPTTSDLNTKPFSSLHEESIIHVNILPKKITSIFFSR